MPVTIFLSPTDGVFPCAKRTTPRCAASSRECKWSAGGAEKKTEQKRENTNNQHGASARVSLKLEPNLAVWKIFHTRQTIAASRCSAPKGPLDTCPFDGKPLHKEVWFTRYLSQKSPQKIIIMLASSALRLRGLTVCWLTHGWKIPNACSPFACG